MDEVQTMRNVNWPTRGDATAFRRRATILATIGVAGIGGCLAAATALNSELLVPMLPLGGACVLLLALWVHGSARTAARRTEVMRSFAGLRVLHHGAGFEVATSDTVLGEYPSRREASRAAMERGSWAIIVHAWDRYYLLACTPAAGRRDGEGARPVALRSRAVADVVPGIYDDIAV